MATARSNLDAFATPYVQKRLREVNSAPSTVINCQKAPGLDFAGYIQTFAGRDLLPPVRQASAAFHLPKVEVLDASNYLAYFTDALEQEREASQIECDEYALYRVKLFSAHNEPRPCIYGLDVPGLRESSLCIEVGDTIQIRQLRLDSHGEILIGLPIYDQLGQPITIPHHLDIRHDAVVWGIDRLRETLSLRIDALKFHSGLFNARFLPQFSRFDALQRAAKAASNQLPTNKWLRSMLFPERSDGELQRTLNTARPNIRARAQEINREQLRAVQNVLDREYGCVPYLITGPPGTGKTKTVVEAAIQLIARDKAARLLLCAPSDAAADMLVQRLRKYITPQQVLRLNAPGRSFPEVPPDVLPCCYIEGEIFSLPPFAELMRKSIVVTTCRDAEILNSARVTNIDLHAIERNLHSALHPGEPLLTSNLHWTGVIMDEAGQATEPEALIPLLVVTPPEEAIEDGVKLPMVVLVGDHNQLGPRTACLDQAVQRSLFQRLLLRPLYSQHPLARSNQTGGTIRPLTKEMLPIVRPPFSDLIRNYRSHPAILAIPSSLFYNDTLEPCAEHTDSLLSWTHFAVGKIPILFASNQSPDEIERDGGGWFNVGEARRALIYAKSVLDQGLLQESEICIMSPFRTQVKILRRHAREQGFPRLNIGPVEAFQGLESRFVIVCTTRTQDRFVDHDIARGLGIIHESRRFNVALTRAKEGLVVIGNPTVLLQDESWASFIAFCWRNKAWNGELNDWHFPHSSKIKISRLEKQLAYREKLKKQSPEGNGITRKVAGLKFGMSEEDAFYESGIRAESVLRDRENDDDNNDDNNDDDDDQHER